VRGRVLHLPHALQHLHDLFGQEIIDKGRDIQSCRLLWHRFHIIQVYIYVYRYNRPPMSSVLILAKAKIPFLLHISLYFLHDDC
jgi:hypothetical protein